MSFFFKIIILLFLVKVLILNSVFAVTSDTDFQTWLISYKELALKKGISQETIDIVFKDVKFLEKVIGYDRKQPEFIEDTATYVSKRATDSKAKKAEKLFKENRYLFEEVENKYEVEKELLLSLWGIETNFGKHVGKMEIVSSLATLS